MLDPKTILDVRDIEDESETPRHKPDMDQIRELLTHPSRNDAPFIEKPVGDEL